MIVSFLNRDLLNGAGPATAAGLSEDYTTGGEIGKHPYARLLP
jgi:hypothetical protein